jgi:hypothetical protein
MRQAIRKAQGATEYAIFIAAVLAGLLALQVYYQRAVKGNMKERADSIGEQLNTADDAFYNRESRSVSGRVSVTNVNIDGSVRETDDPWSNSVVATAGTADGGTDVDASFASGFRGRTGNAAFATGANAWVGGEVSSSEYVTATSSGTGLGSHGVNNLGNVTTEGSVWQDAGID